MADSPEIAVKFGSASVCTTPALSIARSVAVMEGKPLDKADALMPLPETRGPLLAVKGFALLNVTTEVPELMVALRSIPNCLMTLRWTSATLTFSMT